MITTSDAWKTAYLEAVVPETFVEITYDITEPGLQEDATVTHSGVVAFAQPDAIMDTTDKAYTLYATLEQNIWGLDGSFSILPDAAPYGNAGYVSSTFPEDIEWIKAGTFWISEWDTPANGIEVHFVARDLIEFMADTYSGIRSGTLYAIALSALEQSNIPLQANGAPRYVLSDNLKEWSVDFSSDDSDYTCAEIVQLCANAACCIMYQDRNGVLRVEPVRKNASGYAITRYISYAHPEFTLTKPLKSVSVNDGMGTAENAAAGEIQKLSNKLITDTTMANRVAEWVRTTLESRRTLSGEFRANPSLD